MTARNPNFNIIVLKIGTNSITAAGEYGGVKTERLAALAKVSARLQEQDKTRVVIVSSGAMGLGKAKLGSKYIEGKKDENSYLKDTSIKQALTAVGQVELMNAYGKEFEPYNLPVGQVLLTQRGLGIPEREDTVKHTFRRLLEFGIVPIVNANDVVTPKEIEFGDNDNLAAEVAQMLGAKSLYILSDIHGLYDDNPSTNPNANLIKEVVEINESINAVAGESISANATGGMSSKIAAAQICMDAGVEMVIMHASNIEKIPSHLNDGRDLDCTLFAKK